MNSYFDKSKVIEGEVQPQMQVDPAVLTEEVKMIPSLIRTPETGDKVFLVKDGYAHWIMSPEVFDGLNGKWENIISINRNKFKLLQMGERITKDNVEIYKLPKQEPVKEEFKAYDDSIRLERVPGKTSVVIVLYPNQYEKLSQLSKRDDSSNEVILVVNGEKILQENDPRFVFADKVIILKDEIGLSEAMLKGCNVSIGEWIFRIDLYHVK